MVVVSEWKAEGKEEEEVGNTGEEEGEEGGIQSIM